MSENILAFIPTDPSFVPDERDQSKARKLVALFLPHADEIKTVVTNEIEFISSGANFARVICPYCDIEIDMNWWTEAMDKAYKTRFTNLQVNTPCCHQLTSLNHLKYDWASGFARFVLRVRNPDGTELDSEEIRRLEMVLKTPLWKIWAHY